MSSYVIELPLDPDCLDHISIDHWNENSISLENSTEFVKQLSNESVIIFSEDFLIIESCKECNNGEIAGLISLFGKNEAICTSCEKERSIVAKSIFTPEDFSKLINKDVYWPKSKVVQIFDGEKTQAVVIFKENI